MIDLRFDDLWKTPVTWCALATTLLVGAGVYRSAVTAAVVGADEHAQAGLQASSPSPPSDAERTLDLVCGVSPGSLGSVFAGVELGQIVAKVPDMPRRAGLAKISVLTTGRRVDGVGVEVPADPGWADCYKFSDQLHRRWGQPSEATAGSETWHDVAHDRAATFTHDGGDCTLQFFRVVPPEQWLNTSRSSLVPIWAIGHPVAELEAALGLPPGDDPKALHWRDESLGDRFRNVELTAHLRHGRVVGIEVQPPFDDTVGEILWQRLKALYGAPDVTRGHEDSLHVRWRRAPGIEVGKYWGHDADVPMMCLTAERCHDLPASPTPLPPTPDEGVVVDIVFGI